MNDQPPAVPGGVAGPRGDGEDGGEDHRELPELDADVEADEGGQELTARRAELVENAGEAEPVKEPEGEDNGEPPAGEPRVVDFLDCDAPMALAADGRYRPGRARGVNSSLSVEPAVSPPVPELGS